MKKVCSLVKIYGVVQCADQIGYAVFQVTTTILCVLRKVVWKHTSGMVKNASLALLQI